MEPQKTDGNNDIFCFEDRRIRMFPSFLICIYFSFQQQMPCKGSQNSQNTPKSMLNKMHYFFVRSTTEEGLAHGRKTINLSECTLKSMNGRAVFLAQWECRHTLATVRYGYEKQRLSLTMDFGSAKSQPVTLLHKMH